MNKNQMNKKIRKEEILLRKTTRGGHPLIVLREKEDSKLTGKRRSLIMFYDKDHVKKVMDDDFFRKKTKVATEKECEVLLQFFKDKNFIIRKRLYLS